MTASNPASRQRAAVSAPASATSATKRHVVAGMAQAMELRHGVAGDARHVEIEQRHVEAAAVEDRERGAAVGGELDAVAGALEQRLEVLAVGGAVVGDEEPEARRPRRRRFGLGRSQEAHQAAGQILVAHRLLDHGGKLRRGEAGDGLARLARRDEQDGRALLRRGEAVREAQSGKRVAAPVDHHEVAAAAEHGERVFLLDIPLRLAVPQRQRCLQPLGEFAVRRHDGDAPAAQIGRPRHAFLVARERQLDDEGIVRLRRERAAQFGRECGGDRGRDPAFVGRCIGCGEKPGEALGRRPGRRALGAYHDAHAHRSGRALGEGRGQHDVAPRRALDLLAQQVDDELAQLELLALADVRQARIEHQREGEAARLRLRPHQGGGIGQGFAQHEAFLASAGAPAPAPRVATAMRQRAATSSEAAMSRCAGSSRVRAKSAAMPFERVERRAQLVREDGEEAALAGLGALRARWRASARRSMSAAP